MRFRWCVLPLALGAALAIMSARAYAGQPQAEPVSELVQRAMQHYRAGAWKEAAETTEAVLARGEAADAARVESLCLLAAARQKMGEREAALKAIADFDLIADRVSPQLWVHKEMDRVRLAAGAPPKAAEEPGAAGREFRIRDVSTAVWNVRNWNFEGRYADAAALAERLLANDRLHTRWRCDLLMHRAFALVKTRGGDAAEAAFEEFARVANTGVDARAARDELPPGMADLLRPLPPDDPLRLEMALMRESLGLPPLEGLIAPRSTFAPSDRDSYWVVGAPGEAGMDGAALDRLREMCRGSGADGVLVARRGRIVLEWYSPLYREPMATMSSVKSITGLLAGMLINDGRLSLDDRVGDTIESWREGERGRVTVRHLLTMTAGLPRQASVAERAPGEGLNGFAAKQQLAWEPGSRWMYTNEGVQLLSPILERAAGMPLWQYAETRLFTPLGAVNTRLRRDDMGGSNTFADAETTLREFARFGELARRRGDWPGDGGVGRIVPEAWIAAMTTPCPHSKEYGYLWWLHEEPRVWSMQGYLNTSVWVFPDQDVVVARTQARAYLHAAGTFNPEEMMKLIVGACGE